MNIVTKFLGERVSTRFHNHKERGSAVVELGLCLPILLLVVTGITTFGIAFNQDLLLTNAVTVGGQLMAISRGQTTDPCNTVSTAVYTAAPILSKTSFSYTLALTNGTTTNTYTGTGTGFTCTAGATYLLQGATAQLKASYPCKLKVFGVNYAPTCNLTSQITEIVQ